MLVNVYNGDVNMIQIIKKYHGQNGTVIVTQYNDNNMIEYKVEHTAYDFMISWYMNKSDAIVHAQFLASKY